MKAGIVFVIGYSTPPRRHHLVKNTNNQNGIKYTKKYKIAIKQR
jgi:hypothetical protein